jgi:hypothetical protein
MALLLRLSGLLFMATAALTLTAALLAGVYAVGRRNRRLLRSAALVAGGAVAVHAALLLAGPLLARDRVLAPGSEMSFCGFDCHLHVSAARGSVPGAVILRFRSDARAVAEHPGYLRARGIDARGNSYDPLDPIPDVPLIAGDTVERMLTFAPAQGERIDRIALTWRDWESYLVPGPENPLVQRRRTLALAAAPPLRGRAP